MKKTPLFLALGIAPFCSAFMIEYYAQPNYDYKDYEMSTLQIEEFVDANDGLTKYRHSFTLTNTGEGYISLNECYCCYDFENIRLHVDQNNNNDILKPSQSIDLTFVNYEPVPDYFSFSIPAYDTACDDIEIYEAYDFSKYAHISYDYNDVEYTEYTYYFYINSSSGRRDSDEQYYYSVIYDFSYDGTYVGTYYDYYITNSQSLSFKDKDYDLNKIEISNFVALRGGSRNSSGLFSGLERAIEIIVAIAFSSVALGIGSILIIGLTIALVLILKPKKKKRSK